MTTHKKQVNHLSSIEIQQLCSANPAAFYSLCYQAGYLREAFEYFSNHREEKALELGLSILEKLVAEDKLLKTDKKMVRGFVNNLMDIYQTRVAEAMTLQFSAGTVVPIFSSDHAKKEEKEYSTKISRLEAISKNTKKYF